MTDDRAHARSTYEEIAAKAKRVLSALEFWRMGQEEGSAFLEMHALDRALHEFLQEIGDPAGRDDEIRRLRADLAHARHSANKSLSAWYLATLPEKRALAAALWEQSAPHCEHPASDGWEAGMEVPS